VLAYSVLSHIGPLLYDRTGKGRKCMYTNKKGCHDTRNRTHCPKRNTARHYTHVDSVIGALTWAYSVDLTRVNLLACIKSLEEGGYVFSAVCLCVFPSKLGTHILYIRHCSAYIDPDVKRSNVKVTRLHKRHGCMAAAACGCCATAACAGVHII